MLRILTALVLLPLLWVTVKLAPAPIFGAVALLFVGLATWECIRVVGRHEAPPFRWVGVAAALCLAWSFMGLAPHFDPILPLTAATLLTFILAMALRPTPEAMVASAVGTLFPVLVVGLGLSLLVGLRAMPGEDGEDLLMLVFACVILSDTGAYYVGKTFGKRRMAPVLSPKKTWEGLAGGLLASLGGACLAHFWFYQRLPLQHALLLGLLLGAAASLGDLAESALKRAAGVKDSSALLPGHGGVLDRLDSLLFAGPVLYYYYQWFLEGLA